MRDICANIVWFIHLVIVLLIVGVPFTNQKVLLKKYVIVIPFLIVHWIMNDDTCALTILEKKLRNVSKDEAFIQKVVSPIYKIPNDVYGKLCKIVIMCLYCIVLYKLRFKFY